MTNHTSHTSQIDNQLEKSLNQLEALLRQQITTHESLLGILVRKRQALVTANHLVMNECTVRESDLIKMIAQCEKSRLALVGDITLKLDAKAQSPFTMLELAEHLPEPNRGRLLMLRLELRERIQNVQKETGIARRASESLLRHVHGIIQVIGTACTGVSTYGQQGARHQAATAVSTFNTTA